MLLKIKGDNFSDDLFKELQNITDHAILHISDLRYDRERGCVVLSLGRYRISQIKQRLFGTIKTPVYDRATRIRSYVTIKNVANCRIQSQYDCKVLETIIGGGMVVRGRNIYMCSQDEYHGEPFYSLEIGVSSIDITIIRIYLRQG
jgi:hypothetical protein